MDLLINHGKSSGGYCESDKALLFALDIPSNEVGPTNMSRKLNECSIAM